MSATVREEILARLRRPARKQTLPAPWRSLQPVEDLAGHFCQALTAAGGEVHRASSLGEALDQVGAILRETRARTAIVDDQSLLANLDLSSRWPQVALHVVGQSDVDPPSKSEQAQRAFSISADAGISVAEAALAETGTVVIGSGPGRSRLTSLLPPVHLALLPESRLTADLFTWTAGRHDTAAGLWPSPLPSAVTLISGPSKSADIEQTMATGVHGPKRFIVLLFDDRG